jgi:hypothetical protein
VTAEEPFVRLLRHLGDRAVELDEWFFRAGELYHAATQAGLSDAELTESLETLLEKRIILLGRDEAGIVRGGQLTDSGLDCYLQSCRGSYFDEQLGVRRKMAECFYRETPEISDRTIAEALGYPRLVVDHILRVFARHGLLRIVGPGDRDAGEVMIDRISEEVVGGSLLG